MLRVFIPSVHKSLIDPTFSTKWTSRSYTTLAQWQILLDLLDAMEMVIHLVVLACLNNTHHPCHVRSPVYSGYAQLLLSPVSYGSRLAPRQSQVTD